MLAAAAGLLVCNWRLQQKRSCSRRVPNSIALASGPAWWWKGGPGDASEEEMQVCVPVPDTTTSADVVVDIQRTSLTIGLKGQEPVLAGDLWKEIKAHESGWVLDREDGQKCIVVTLIKRDIWIDYDYLLKEHELFLTRVTSKCYMDVTINGEATGRLVFGLYGQGLPRTTANFYSLCAGEKKLGSFGSTLHYKGCIFSRIVPGHIAQGGDVTGGTSPCGESIYGPTFLDENLKIRHSKRGLLSMVNVGPNTNGSQFFITMGECPELDGRNVVFGEVLEGFEVIQAIESQGDPKCTGRVLGEVVIQNSGAC